MRWIKARSFETKRTWKTTAAHMFWKTRSVWKLYAMILQIHFYIWFIFISDSSDSFRLKILAIIFIRGKRKSGKSSLWNAVIYLFNIIIIILKTFSSGTSKQRPLLSVHVWLITDIFTCIKRGTAQLSVIVSIFFLLNWSQIMEMDLVKTVLKSKEIVCKTCMSS